jgi:ATP-binding cassette subfamily C protein
VTPGLPGGGGGNGFRLKVVRPASLAHAVEETAFEGAAVRMGRAADCDLVLTHDTVSRYHAEVRRAPEGSYLLVDLGSTNGVWVGKERVSERALASGDLFRLGDVELEFRLPLPETVDAPTRIMPAVLERTMVQGAAPAEAPADAPIESPAAAPVPPAPAQPERAPEPAPVAAPMVRKLDARFLEEGQLTRASSNKPFLLSGEDNVWYVEAGKVEIFTVPVENDQPVGARSHFATMGPGACMFGMDIERFAMGAGFLAVGSMSTMLRRLSVRRLQEIAEEPGLGSELAEKLDAWVATLSRSLTKEMIPGPIVDVTLERGAEVALRRRETARPAKGVTWIEVMDGNLLFIGMEELVFQRERGTFAGTQHSMVVRLDDLISIARQAAGRDRLFFPVSSDTWVEGSNADEQSTRIATHEGSAVARDPGAWRGLTLFHEVLCQCEFINKRLSMVDEINRLETKAEHAEVARQDANRAIARVLEDTGVGLPAVSRDADPAFSACVMIGRALGMRVVNHPDLDRQASFNDRVAMIAKASRFRTRPIALRGDWWRHDQGPILAKVEKTEDPVALLPKGPTAYVAFDPRAGTERPVDRALIETLAPFGTTFYPPFPDGDVSVKTMVRFGARDLKGDAWWLLAMGIAMGILGTLTPVFTGKLFDTAIPEAERGLVFQFTMALFIAAVASSAFKITQSIATLRIQGKLDYTLQAAVWDRLLNLPSTFFRDYPSGDLADRAAGINAIRGLISGAGVGSILGAVSSLFYVVVMFQLNVKMGLLALLLTVILVGATVLMNYLQLRFQRERLMLQGRIVGLVLQLISGVGKLRVSGAENHAFRIWAREFSAQRRIEFRIGKIQGIAEVFNSGFPILTSMAIFYALVVLTHAAAQSGGRGMSTGEFIAFSAAFGAFQAAMQALGQASLDLLKIVPIYERMQPILTTAPEIDETKAYPGKLKGKIEVSHVSFRYAEDGPLILNDVSLTIEPGEFVAFVGSSGCGKSTLFRLILGFEKPEKGSVLFDGQDLATLDLREVRQQVGVVLQNSQLMPAELYRNIIGTTSLTIDDAWEAARLAGLADDVEDMPMGMHTYVSEGGGGLSGGQRQRLLIARALARRPRILFFDEATSALDNRSQATVTESMERLQASRIVIAHRLSTIINADRIYYLDAGRVAEVGSYEELMKVGGLFATLARRQMA